MSHEKPLKRLGKGRGRTLRAHWMELVTCGKMDYEDITMMVVAQTNTMDLVPERMDGFGIF